MRRRIVIIGCVLFISACSGKSSSNHADASGAGGSGNGAAGRDAGVTSHATGGSGTGATTGSAAGGGAGTAGRGSDAGAADGGTAGHATGGDTASGSSDVDAGAQAGTSGDEDCDMIAADYSAALMLAKMCHAGATDQCQTLVSITLPCPSCVVRVNDASKLQALAQRYQQADCHKPPRTCPAIACINPGVGNCNAINSGDFCQ